MSIFKAYDIRGIYKETIDEGIVYKIGRAYVLKFRPKKVTVGRDVRVSSPSLFKALVKGITDQGCNVVDIGIVTTPMMYFSVWNYGHEGGLMISASHNPPEYNGIKMVRKDAVPIGGETGIYEIGEMVSRLPDKLPGKKGKVEKLNVMDSYIAHSLSYLKKKLKKFRVVTDTANAVGGPTASKFFKKLGLELIHLFPELDGNFPNHEANPLKEENLNDLKEAVLKNKADIGIAFDGDADRCAFVDEKGNTVQSDMIIGLVAKAILAKEPGRKILYDVRCSRAVEDIIKISNGVPGRCMVGHSLVKAQMKREKAKFAGELSSHFYLEDEHYAEAPFFVIIKVLEMMTEENKKLSELVAPLRKYFQSGEINSQVEDKERKMREIAERFSDAEVTWLDGVTVEYGSWWFNVRPSNTEPYLRLNLEADTKKLMEKKREEILSIIRS
ncbi:Phosphomannomutase [archaeon GW2011_AR15]|nr:Phosphomannomutase [archaeon GW2011_AR15]MBS3104273.1 phosphomannomutase/phosphoglucomutase [Candidatus Woesearchaeota archaeon]